MNFQIFRFLFLPLAVMAVLMPAHARDVEKPVCGLSLYTIEGTSMSPLIRPGDKVETIPPQCLGREIIDGDIIVFNNAAARTAIIKRVIARGGDKFSVKDGGVIVNDKPVVTADGREFRLTEARLGMIRLYESSYKGVIPETAFLVMGEQSGGTTDSTRFGVVDLSDIKGVMVQNLNAAKRAAGTAGK